MNHARLRFEVGTRGVHVDENALFEEVRAWVGATRMHNAELAMGATLKALGDALLHVDATMLARELPPSLAMMVRGAAHGSALSQGMFYSRVAGYENVPMTLAVEHAQGVCRALGALLPPSMVSRLRTALPFLAWLFVTSGRDVRPTRPEGLAARSRG